MSEAGVGDYVVASELRVPEGSGPVLEEAFANRLREVEGYDGFLRLEVWRDLRDPQAYVMVSWWRDHDAFVAYMRSPEHDRSHARIPQGEHKPRGVGLSRYEVVAR